MEVTMISRGVEISIAGGVAETEDGNYCDLFFSFFFFFFFFFLNHMFIVSKVQEITCIFNHMAKTKPKIKHNNQQKNQT